NLVAALGSTSLLKVNEWMPAPINGDDWFEIFNPGAQPVALGGLSLTDNLGVPNKSPVQALSFIGVGLFGFQQFKADNHPENGADHVAFALSSTAESIGIFTPALVQIDAISYISPLPGVSYGRLPD